MSPSLPRRVSLETEAQTRLLTLGTGSPRGDLVRLLFVETAVAGGAIWFRVRSPTGALVMERLLRELPTSAHASLLTVPIHEPGDYLIDMQPLPGTSSTSSDSDEDGRPTIPRQGARAVLRVA